MNELCLFDNVTQLRGDKAALENAADALYKKMLISFEELAIKKYGRIPEAIIQEIFKETEIRTRNSVRPVVYIQLNSENIQQYQKKNQTEFYKNLVEQVLNSIEQTRYSNTSGVKAIRNSFQNDFDSIYSTKECCQLIQPNHNIGANLKQLIHTMIGDTFYYPIALIDITALPNFPKDSVTVLQKKEKDSTATFNEKTISCALSIMQGFFLGGQGLKKTVAVPGWIVDILQYSWTNQKWNKSGLAEAVILEEWNYRQVLEL